MFPKLPARIRQLSPSHNPKVGGSNPPPAITQKPLRARGFAFGMKLKKGLGLTLG